MEYEETPLKKIVKKQTQIKIKDWEEVKDEMNKETYKQTKVNHKEQIKKLRADIKKHQLLIKQAKIVYKLSRA